MDCRQPANALNFLRNVGKLKHLLRTGWVKMSVDNPETVSGHMYRMAIMALTLDGIPEDLRTKCVEMSLVHDIGECIAGDITPHCGVSTEEKYSKEKAALNTLSSQISESRGNLLNSLWQEYEAQSSEESKIVKNLDIFDMLLQAFEYEVAENSPGRLQEFFDSSSRKIDHDCILPIFNELIRQRDALRETQTDSHQS